jgi:hypothetical protein
MVNTLTPATTSNAVPITSTTVPPSNTIIDLPLKGHKKVPKTFTGDYRKVKDFFINIESTCNRENVSSSKEKCKAVVQYCSQEVTNVINGLISYKEEDYDRLKNDIIFIYDGERTEVEYGIADIRPFIKEWNKKKIRDLPTYKSFYKEFQKIVRWLYVQDKVTEDEYKLWFWAGLPKRFRRKIEERLRVNNPTLDVTKPFEIKSITKVVQKMYTQDRFENQIPLLLKGQKKKKKKVNSDSESSDDDKESDEESSSDESEEEPTITTKIKEMTKPKKCHELNLCLPRYVQSVLRFVP